MINLFDVFTFKKEVGKIFNKENIFNLLGTAKDLIIDQIAEKVSGAEKKDLVDSIVCEKLEDLATGCKNKLVLWVVDKAIELVPTITQNIYDNLKEKVANLTK